MQNSIQQGLHPTNVGLVRVTAEERDRIEAAATLYDREPDRITGEALSHQTHNWQGFAGALVDILGWPATQKLLQLRAGEYVSFEIVDEQLLSHERVLFNKSFGSVPGLVTGPITVDPGYGDEAVRFPKIDRDRLDLITRLRRENEQLRNERDALKAAVGELQRVIADDVERDLEQWQVTATPAYPEAPENNPKRAALARLDEAIGSLHAFSEQIRKEW